jgi:hypothetical protein
MPRKYIRKTPPGTVRPRDEKGRLLPATAAMHPHNRAPQPKAKQKPGPQPGPKKSHHKKKPPLDVVGAMEHAAAAPVPPAPPEGPVAVPSVFLPPPAPADGLYPGTATWERLKEMAGILYQSGMKPPWMLSVEQVLATLLRGYELRVGATQILWNTYRGDDGRPLNTAELMRSLVQRSGVGYLRPVVRTNQEVTYEGVRYGKRGDGSDDVKLTVTWTVADLSGSPLKGMPRHTLDARCTSELCRTLFADIAGGYTAEDFDLGTAVRQAPPSGGAPAEVPPSPPTAPPGASVSQPAAPEASAPEPEPPAAEPAPTPAPAAAQEPIAAPEPAPEPQAEAPVQSAPQPAPVEPPVSAHEEVMPGRVLHRLIQVTTPDGQVRAVYSAGISADQVDRIYKVAGQKHQEAAQKWLGSKQLKKLSWCTEPEADELIAYLAGLDDGGKPAKPAPPPLTFERAYGIFQKELDKIGLPVEQAAAYIAQKAGVGSIRDLLPEQVVQAAEDFKALAAADLNSFKLAFARVMEQEGIDPSGGSTPF